jgi:hypothetical protein
LQTIDFLQWHREHSPIAEPDYLRADPPAAGGRDLAEITDRRQRVVSGENGSIIGIPFSLRSGLPSRRTR